MSSHAHSHAEHHKHPDFDPDETLSLDETHEDHGHHATPFWTMFIVFALLLFLTVITVFQSRIPTEIMPETMHILAAVGIAAIKAVLVAAFFMHLKYDKPMNTVVLSATIFAVILFIGFSALDLGSRDVVERKEAGDIYVGGNLKLYAGSISPDKMGPNHPLVAKPDAGIVGAAHKADAAHAGNEGHGEAAGADHAPAGDAAGGDHAPAKEAPKAGGH
jgi:cytochrome c oxidase subunit 4